MDNRTNITGLYLLFTLVVSGLSPKTYPTYNWHERSPTFFIGDCTVICLGTPSFVWPKKRFSSVVNRDLKEYTIACSMLFMIGIIEIVIHLTSTQILQHGVLYIDYWEYTCYYIEGGNNNPLKICTITIIYTISIIITIVIITVNSNNSI